jgi:signal transduction histidine kinase
MQGVDTAILAPLLALTQQLSAACSHEDVAQIVATSGIETFAASAGFVAVQSADGHALEMLSHVRLDQPETPLCRLEGDARLPVIDAWRFGAPVLVRSSTELAERFPDMDRGRAHREALAALPLAVDGECLGAINLTFATPQAFDEPMQQAMLVVANVCAQALLRVRLSLDLESARRDFAITASHELRSPLTSIYAAAVALDGDMVADHARAELTHVIVGQSERMMRVIDDLRLASELDAGSVRCAREPIDVSELLDGVCARWSDRPSERERIHLDARLDVPVARGDRTRLTLVLRHLVDNALRYSTDAAPVLLTASRIARDRIAIDVLDEGPGMHERDLERAFEKFFRADAMQRNGVSGTGLGLFVSRRLTEAMGGSIELLERDGDGGGLRARVTLPTWS